MRVRQTGWAAVVVMLCAGAAAAQDVPVEPPVPPPPPVRIEAIPNGYQIFLNRPAAELLLRAVESADEKQIAAAIRDEAAKRKDVDPDSAAKLELIAFVVNGQL